MRLLLIACVIAALQSDTTALVEASKAAKAKKKTSTTKVITNADVKKSKGKLVVKPGAAAAETKPEPTLLEKQAVDRAERQAREAKLAELDKTIAALGAEVAALEQSYYDTNDLDERDKVIAPKFAIAKAKLDAAKLERSGAAGSSPPSESANEPGGLKPTAPPKP